MSINGFIIAAAAQRICLSVAVSFCLIVGSLAILVMAALVGVDLIGW